MPDLVRKGLGAFTYSSGQRQTLQIDRDGILTQLNLRVRYTITNGGTAAVGPLFAALSRIVQRFEVQLNGKDTIINSTGEQLVARAFKEFGTLPFGLDATVVLTASTATTYEIVIPVSFALPNAVRAMDTRLECRTLQQVTVAVTFANSDCSQIYTTPNGAAISNVTCDLQGMYEVNGSIIDPKDPAYFVRVIDFVSQTNAATNNSLSVQMDRGPQAYRTFDIIAQRGSIGVDNIINNIRLDTGTFVFSDESANYNRSAWLREYGLYQAPAANVLTTGCYRINMSPYGSLATAINVNPDVLKTDLFLRFNTTYTSGTEQILISREAIRKPNV